MQVTQLLKISTTVADLPKAAAFYAERLGFVPGAEMAIDDAESDGDAESNDSAESDDSGDESDDE